MRGLYNNVNGVTHIAETFSNTINEDTKLNSYGDVNIITSKDDNSNYYTDKKGNEIFMYGWVTYKGKANDLRQILDDFMVIVSKQSNFSAFPVESGNFLILIYTKSEKFVLTDPWGLAPHYARYDGGKIIQIAPTPAFIKENASVNELYKSILEKKNHLFGDVTLYNEIKRLSPGVIFNISNGNKQFYFDYISTKRIVLEDAIEDFAKNYGFNDARYVSLLPISGGLDSRLVLATHNFSYGYTFGPKDTGDRPVARKFSHCFDKYDEFSFKELSYDSRVKDYAGVIFDGTCSKPFAELLEVYKKTKQSNPKGRFFYDGYLGDVLLRGTYFNHTSFRGNLEKIFVYFIHKSFTPKKVFKERYSELDSKEFKFLLSQFYAQHHIQNLPILDTHKYLLFEILYGRGARHIANGGTIMASQFYSVVQPFFQNKLFFDLLFQQSPKQMLNWHYVKPIFKKLPAQFSAKTYTGYSPLYAPFISRVIMLGNKFLSKLNLIKGSQSYDDELSEIIWKDKTMNR